MEIKKSFTGGKMNKSLDDRLLPNGIYKHAENVKVSVTDDDDSGVVQNYLGNTESLDVNDLLISEGFVDQGDTMVPIGSYTDTRRNDIYWFITARDYDIIAVYHENNDGTSNGKLLLVETKGPNAMMNFDSGYLITGVNIVDDLLFFTDGLNSPKRLLITEDYRDGNISSDTVNVIVKPPLEAPEIRLSFRGEVEENTIEDKFIRFSYRYKYKNNEISALSPFSKTAFQAQEFKFDFNTGRNESMRNKANGVSLTLDMGGPDVVEAEIIMKDTRSMNAVVVGSVKKGSKQIEEYFFQNNKIHRTLPDVQLARLFDNVPLSAKAQDVIGRRIVYGNYKQFFDIKKATGDDIVPNMNLSYLKTPVVEGTANETFKSGRDYEVGIAYLDEFGRMTTVLESEKANTTIPISSAKNKNELVLSINHTAPNQADVSQKSPFFASSYRLFFKQNRSTYYNIIPTSVHKDGLFVYFQIAQYDIDKVKSGDYIYIKSTPSGPREVNQKYKVLEAGVKEENFLKSTSGTDQESGFYIKLKIEDSLFSDDSYDIYKDRGVGFTDFGGIRRKDGTVQPLSGSIGNYVEDPIFYGSGNGTLASLFRYSRDIPYAGAGGVNIRYRLNSDRRFVVEVTGARTFSFRDYNTSWYYEQNVTMNSETMPDGSGGNVIKATIDGDDYAFAYIQFADGVDYNVGDKWTLNYRGVNYNINGSPVKFNRDDRTDGPFTCVPDRGSDINNNEGDLEIKPGSVIKIRIDESGDQGVQKFISSGEYENIEEWFYEERIYEKFKQLMPDGRNDGAQSVFFRRGVIKKVNKSGQTARTVDKVGNPKGYIVMFIKGYIPNENKITDKDADQRKFIYLHLSVTTPDNISILETEGVNDDKDIYYELPTTYPIVGGLHYGLGDEDENQTVSSAAIIKIKDFNAICFGNGMESSVIEDDWNGPEILPSPRASAAIDRYEQINAENSLTYSGLYNDSTSTNNLNEFNISQANFKALEQQFGPIQKLYARDTDLIVFQEDKVSKVLYGKNILFDSAGGGNVSSIQEVIGLQYPYTGEFGISNNPESFAKWGNDVFFTDEKRGAVLNLTQAGIKQISNYGMRSYFRDLFDDTAGKQKLGAFDPHEFKYVLSWNEKEVASCELSATPNDLVITGEQVTDGFLFSIKSNTDWTIDVAQTGSWLVLSTYEGQGDRVITGSLTSNLSNGFDREATITITYCGGLTKIITLRQSKDKIKVVNNTTTGDTKNDGAKSVRPSYDSPSGGYQGGSAPLGGEGEYYTYDPLEDFVGLNNIPDIGDTVDIIGETDFEDANGNPLKPFNPDLGNKMYYLDTDDVYEADQGDALKAAATEVTPVLDGSVYKGSFTYNGTGDNLYILTDYTNILDMGVSVTNIPTSGTDFPEAINLNNSSLLGRYTVTYSSTSTNIRFVIENSLGAIIADSGYVSTPSSDTFSVTKRTAGSDVIKVYGPEGSQTYDISISSIALTSFTISDEGYDTTADACASTTTQTAYHDGNASLPVPGDVIYSSSDGSSVLNGNNLYYEIGTNAVLVGPTGVVLQQESCTCSETAVPVIDQLDIEILENDLINLKISATNNPTVFEAAGNCKEYQLYGGSDGAVFQGTECDTGLVKQYFVSSTETISLCLFIGSVSKLGGSDDASFSELGGCTSESLPEGIELNDNGILSGAAKQPGDFNLTVTATNCFGTSAEHTFTITVKPEKEAIPEFKMDTTNPQTSSANACAIGSPSYSTMYHNGILDYPVIYDMIYSDPEGLNLYNGNNQWFLTESGVAILVDADGIVTDTFLCGINTPTPPAYDSVSLAYGVDASAACSSSTFTTYYYDGTFGVNPGNLYEDAAGTTPAAAGNYKYDTGGGFIQFPWDGTTWGAPVDCPL